MVTAGHRILKEKKDQFYRSDWDSLLMRIGLEIIKFRCETGTSVQEGGSDEKDFHLYLSIRSDFPYRYGSHGGDLGNG